MVPTFYIVSQSTYCSVFPKSLGSKNWWKICAIFKVLLSLLSDWSACKKKMAGLHLISALLTQLLCLLLKTARRQFSLLHLTPDTSLVNAPDNRHQSPDTVYGLPQHHNIIARLVIFRLKRKVILILTGETPEIPGEVQAGRCSGSLARCGGKAGACPEARRIRRQDLGKRRLGRTTWAPSR